MSDFNEFDRPLGPEKNTSGIIAHAWENYKGVIGYGILFAVIISLVEFLFSLLFPGSPLNPKMLREIIDASKNNDVNSIKEIIEANRTSGFGGMALSFIPSLVSKVLLFPLSAGLLYITHKFNTRQNILISDLFVGYRQNTANLLLYGLVIHVLANIGIFLCVLPGIYMYIVGFVGLPFVFFGNKNLSEGLNVSFNTTNQNFGLVLGTAILAALISVSGFLLCCIGIFITQSFLIIAAYSLYCALFGTPYEVEKA